ncbi:MAG: hypothetical protein ACK53Y_13505, partial [bacterium]
MSRSFSLSDHELLESLQRLTPTQPPWKLVTPPVHSTSSMNWALSRTLPPGPSPLGNKHLPIPRGPFGQTSATASP